MLNQNNIPNHFLGQIDTEISYKDLENLFDPKSWHVGVLTKEQLLEVSLMPIKFNMHPYGVNFTNDIFFRGLTNCLVLANAGHNWDYTHYNQAEEIMANSPYNFWFPIYTNYKEAALRSGLGVRARNSLIYDYKFGFDVHYTVMGINNTIIDVPTNRRHNTRIWNRCIGCDDCMVKCPVGAIRNKDKVPWINSTECDRMIGYGNPDNKDIPSIKDFWHKNVYPEIPQEVINKVHNYDDLLEHTGKDGMSWDRNGYTFDGQVVRHNNEPVNVPFCRECTSQPTCSKWNGKFPYERVEGRIDQIELDI